MENPITNRHWLFRLSTVVAVLIVIGAAVAIVPNVVSRAGGQDPMVVSLGTEYQAVFLQNGLVLYGKLEGFGKPYPTLTDVYYIRSDVQQESKEVRNRLVRRGSEFHAPDRMILNASQILFVEPVKADSTVAGMIRSLQK